VIFDTNGVSAFFDGLPEVVKRVAEEPAGHYAVVRHRLRLAGTPIPENDIWIAALCLQHGQKILSNDRHFDVVQGVTRVGW